MAAGVASGAVALLLDERPGLSPREVKFILQVTASHVADSGFVTAGTGLINVVGAATFAKSRQGGFPTTAS